jgi:hypothetical protein
VVEPQKFKKILDLAYSAYQEYNCTGQEMIQKGKVSFVVHPIWCAVLLLNDIEIPEEDRYLGYQAFLLHDVLEGTSLTLLEDIDPKVVDLIKAMTHPGGWEEKREMIVEKLPPLVQLLKLIDKMCSMYNRNVRPDPQKRKEWKALAERLYRGAREHYGDAMVIRTAKNILDNTDW